MPGPTEQVELCRPTLRVVVTGDAGTGKTCLIRRYVNNYFPKKNKETIKSKKQRYVGLEYALKLAQIKDADGSVMSVVVQIADDDDTSLPRDEAVYGYHHSACCQKANGAMMTLEPKPSLATSLDAVAQRKAEFDSDAPRRVQLIVSSSEKRTLLD